MNEVYTDFERHPLTDKYFTPSIEDIRVGYECEINNGVLPGISEGWGNYKIEHLKEIERIHRYGLNILRVPYLTNEQITAEGWQLDFSRHVTPGVAYWKGKEADRYTIWYINSDQYGRHLCIEDTKKGVIYKGQCKDINTFRYITKLLNI